MRKDQMHGGFSLLLFCGLILPCVRNAVVRHT